MEVLRCFSPCVACCAALASLAAAGVVAPKGSAAAASHRVHARLHWVQLPTCMPPRSTARAWRTDWHLQAGARALAILAMVAPSQKVEQKRQIPRQCSGAAAHGQSEGVFA